MGKRGPKRTPTAVHQMRGSRKGRERSQAEVTMPAGAPEPPEELSVQARQVWDQTIARLSEVPGLLTRVDGSILARYCEIWVRWWRASKKLEKSESYPIFLLNDEGNRVINSDGVPVVKYWQQWPEVSIVRTLHASMLQVEREFGLTPASRAGLSITPVGESEDGLETFKFGVVG